jgi:hypothetical protein
VGVPGFYGSLPALWESLFYTLTRFLFLSVWVSPVVWESTVVWESIVLLESTVMWESTVVWKPHILFVRLQSYSNVAV